MKTLYLIRHAKSSWNNVGLSDYDRPLNERGKMDAPEMGSRLLKRNEIPNIVISSTAKRARSTVKKITKAIGYNPDQIVWKEELYHASSSVIISTINNIDNAHGSAFVVGHNPGMSYAAYELSGLPTEMVTCSIVKIEFEVDDWQEVFADTGSLIYHDYPKK